MIRELQIRQFALIDRLELHFEAGTTALTGETGAGKSIVVDALGALFGARARSGWVRHGARRAEVAATLEPGDDTPARRWLEAEQLDDDGPLLLRRTIGADGRSRAWINGVAVPLRQLQQLGALLLDLHGQHEHQALLRADYQRLLIDGAVDPAITDAAREAWRTLKQATAALEAFDARQRQRETQADWMAEQLQRLETLQPEPGVIERLTAEIETLRHAGAIRASAAAAIARLEGEEPPGARSGITAARAALIPEQERHPALAEALTLLEQVEPLIDEAVRALRPALEVEGDDARLDALEARICGLQEAMRRHGCDAEGLCTLMAQWRDELQAQQTAEWDRQRLEAARAEADARWRRSADALHAARCAQAERLCAALRPLLDRLGLEALHIRVEVEADPDGGGPAGCDRIRWLAASNTGEPFRPLAEVASGGELSRIVLALKGCGALRNPAAIAVFDEVDVGIGGETAWCVGGLLAAMGRDQQLFVVSHLPQVAACADRQIHIAKEQREGRTVIRVRPLDDEDRVGEIARMLGDGTARLSREQARAMLERGAQARARR
ncbi:MAG: DNA repair protein RecN [Zetaproteobacteria bacterium]|nr:MAG: DNA repair protein RecN [Zetaproteobacteria bacterium]